MSRWTLRGGGGGGAPFDGQDSLREERDRLQSLIRSGTSISIAFANADPDQRDNLIRAADYTDEWITSGEGERKVAFRYDYICRANLPTQGGKCESATAWCAWLRRHEDPVAAQQRWYCKLCGARYSTTFGVLVEFRMGRQARFVRAVFSPSWAQDLLARLPFATPAKAPFIFPVDPGNEKYVDVYGMNPDIVSSMPMWVWKSMLSLV